MGKYDNPPFRENPYKLKIGTKSESPPEKSKSSPINFEMDRLCPSCGKIIKVNHNFCKFCGADLSAIQPLGNSDRTLVELAKTALTDGDADVRKDAVDTLGDLAEVEVLGILTYILLNDIDALVRKEAAEELGNIHNPISIDVLTKALKDRSPIVRKQAIEGLKKIKKMNKAEPKLEKELVSKDVIESDTEQKSEIDDNDFEDEPLKQIDPHNNDEYKL